jgi:hypothetical protein
MATLFLRKMSGGLKVIWLSRIFMIMKSFLKATRK